MKRTFKMNDHTYTSMMDIARELGVKRVYPRDFDKYGIVELTEGDSEATAAEPEQTKSETKAEATAEAVAETSAEAEAPVVEDKTEVEPEKPKAVKKHSKQTKADKKPSKEHKQHKVGSEEDIKELVESLPNLSLEDFQTTIKHFTNDALIALAAALKKDINQYPELTNAPIRKMRLIMELKKALFPGQYYNTVKKSCWKKLSLDELKKIAKDNNLTYKVVDDEKVQRMFLIMELNKAGVKPAQEVKEGN
nr:MAG TPA: hypothetical protein [Herelleviridae sp.]